MKQSIIYSLLIGAAAAHPMVSKREVPQEHAHQAVLDQVDALLGKNNPDNIKSSVFGLLGAKAAAEGAGNIKDPDCLQQAAADQAFTNAKAAGDVAGMTAALIFRGLERNSGSVGLASPPCASIKAVNPEIAAIQQHQDPASDGAAELNKGITLEIAKQIVSIGGNAQDALEAGTFAPGQKGDPTAKGNTCDDANDKKGCIDSQNLRVDDATAAEIDAAVAGAGNGAVAGNAAAGNATQAAGAGAKKGGKKGNKGAKANANNNKAAMMPRAGQFGSCADPSIVFSQNPSDGRKEPAFENKDLTDFNHGSALNIKVIADFTCNQLTNKCKAGADVVAKCNQASSAASSLKGQAAADAFNKALGV